jgi:hypothetical protein
MRSGYFAVMGLSESKERMTTMPGYLEKPPRTDKEFILNRACRVMERWGRPWGRNSTVEYIDSILTGDRYFEDPAMVMRLFAKLPSEVIAAYHVYKSQQQQ